MSCTRILRMPYMVVVRDGSAGVLTGPRETPCRPNSNCWMLVLYHDISYRMQCSDDSQRMNEDDAIA